MSGISRQHECVVARLPYRFGMPQRLLLSRGRALAVDLVAVGVGLVAMLYHLFVTADVVGSRWWLGPLFLFVPVALLWRRRVPLPVLVAVAVPIAVQAVVTGRPSEGFHLVWPVAVALYSLAAYGSHRQVAAGVGLVVVALTIHDVNDTESIFHEGQASTWAWAFFLLVEVAVLLFGLFVGAHRRQRRLREERAEAERHRQRETAAAVAEERARIARELHDVVTHKVNVVVLQAMAAAGVLDSAPERAREPLGVIEDSGREALVEMRRLLGMLHEDGPADAPRPPAPALGDLPGLVAGICDVGQDVKLTISGDQRRVPAAVALAVYRVAQESLTNVLKHAPGARTTVRIDCMAGAVEVEVVDSGAVLPHQPPAHGGGHGLIGMRERVEVFGGHLVTGPRVDGGYGVWARLPLMDGSGAS